MAVNCSVPTCKSRYGNVGVSFHEYPVQDDVRQQWIRNIKRKDWLPASRSVVCSLHFKSDDYVEGRQRRVLKQSSVPTVFENFPSNLQHEVSRTTRIRRPPIKRTLDTAGSSKTRKRSKILKNALAADHEEEFPDPRTTRAILEIVPEPEPEIQTTLQSTSPRDATLASDKIKRKKTRNPLAQRLRRSQCLNKKLLKENRNLRKLIADSSKNSQIQKIYEDADEGVLKAKVIVEQIQAYGRKWNKWSEEMIRECVILRAKSSRAYDYIRGSGLFKLPSGSTLRRYVGPVSFQTGITDLIKQRLQEQKGILKPEELLCSLIFDEMSIKPMLRYVKQADKIIGQVSYGNLKPKKRRFKKFELANRLLCFLLKGLSTSYRIPVAYFFTRQLDAAELASLLKDTVLAVEDLGFKVVRLVADNSRVNVKAFKDLSQDKIVHYQIPHFADPSRPLFLSYDYCHIIKNARNNLMSENRKMFNAKKPVSGSFIQRLYELQESSLMKPVRYLTRKMISPNSLEKMNVNRAVRLFSVEVTAALKYMKTCGLEEFKTVDETLKFMENMRKWFELHDVSNRSHYYKSKNSNKQHYWLLEDTRLRWLEGPFIEYLNNWKQSCMQQSRAIGYLTKDTDMAIRVTTKSTVECTRYLLNSGFHFVLTRRFSSDDVESFFGGLRQMLGSNDQTDAVSVVYAIEKILKVGILSSSPNSNVHTTSTPKSIYTEKPKQNYVRPTKPKYFRFKFPGYIENDAKKLHQALEISDITPEKAGVSLIAGFLCRAVADNVPCNYCGHYITNPEKNGAGSLLIKLQDRGGLLYPSSKFLGLTIAILEFLEKYSAEFRQVNNVSRRVCDLIRSSVERSGILKCGCGDSSHSSLILEIVLSKLSNIYCTNSAFFETENEDWQAKCNNKPLSRKVLKL